MKKKERGEGRWLFVRVVQQAFTSQAQEVHVERYIILYHIWQSHVADVLIE